MSYKIKMYTKACVYDFVYNSIILFIILNVIYL